MIQFVYSATYSDVQNHISVLNLREKHKTQSKFPKAATESSLELGSAHEEDNDRGSGRLRNGESDKIMEKLGIKGGREIILEPQIYLR